jgi:hypothetical protein
MTKAGEFLGKTQFTAEIGGVEFVLRRLSRELALKAWGSRLFGIVAAHNAKGDIEPKEKDVKKMEEAGRKLLEACMVSPRLGPTSNPDDDVISYDDLEVSGYGGAVFQAIMGSVEPAANFTQPSGGLKGAELQDGSTPLASDTESVQAS